MQQFLLYTGQTSKEIYIGFLILVLFSSLVIADPNSQLNLPEGFELNVDAIFERENKLRQPKQDENVWREKEFRQPGQEENAWEDKSERSSREVRWGAKSIYEANPNRDPFNYNDNNPRTVVKPVDVTPQFELRF